MRLPPLLLTVTAMVTMTLAGCASGGAAAPGAPTPPSAPSAPTPQRRQVDIGGASLVMSTESSADVVTVQAPIARVWDVLRAAYDSVGVGIGTLDPRTYTIGNLGYKVRQRLGRTPLSRYLDCGGSTQVGPNADSYDVILGVTSTLRPAGAAATQMTTTVDAQARPATFNQSWSRCTSRGTLEKRLADLVRAQLAR
ncbi:MAG: hypothetical protein KJT01_05910 [Gemmatimonadetes bacterium]|nr:hypothetical protein [Gemmatimonadota bacterium]